VDSLSVYTRVSPPVVYVLYLMGLVIREWLFDSQAPRCWETRMEKLAQFGGAKPSNYTEYSSVDRKEQY